MTALPPLILVVEDDYPLQAMVEEALLEAGFATDILSSAEEALTLFRSGMKEYRALVADVNLKGRLSGWDLARQVREREPTLPVVYMTGGVADDRCCKGSQAASCCRSRSRRPSSSQRSRSSSIRSHPRMSKTAALTGSHTKSASQPVHGGRNQISAMNIF